MRKAYLILMAMFLIVACVSEERSIQNITAVPIVMSTLSNIPAPTNRTVNSPPLNTTITSTPTQAVIQTSETNTAVPTLKMISDPTIAVTVNSQWEVQSKDFFDIPAVLVPIGCFTMGREDGYPHEAPVHKVCIDTPFWIDRTEVTNQQYAAFLNAIDLDLDPYVDWIFPGDGAQPEIILVDERWEVRTGYQDDPAHGISWFGAAAQCEWRGGRLPTEPEWEYAARGPDSVIFPWGNKLDEDKVVRIVQLVPDFKIPIVGSKPAGISWVGALDMSSSLLEWTRSIYQSYPYNPEDGREKSIQDDPKSERVLRSGSWYHNVAAAFLDDNIASSARFRSVPQKAHWSYGFRCVFEYDREK